MDIFNRFFAGISMEEIDTFPLLPLGCWLLPIGVWLLAVVMAGCRSGGNIISLKI